MLFAAGAAILPACGSSADGRSTTPVDTKPTAAGPVETRLTVPQGLQVTVFGTVSGARAMAIGPDGSVYVSQPGSNQVTRLVDANGDGAAESKSVAVSGLNRPHGMAFHNGWMYIANTDGIVRVKLDANGVPSGAPEVLNHFSGGGAHSTRSIVFGPDGKMYVSIGSTCNLCVETDSMRAAIIQYDANGANGKVYARGLRNAVGIAFNPATGELWASQNERDDLSPSHEDLPPEEINIIHAGGDYGWPYCYGNRIPNPEYHNAARCASTIAPALEMQAHSAPLSMAFLAGATALPSDYAGDAVVAFHGSWDRSVPTGAKVVRIHISNGKPVSYDDLVTGWQRPDGGRWGRPVDTIVAKDGSLLISDDASGEIVRVAKAG